MPHPLQLVVNPSAGAGRARRALPAVERALRRAGHDLRSATTRSLAHAEDLAAAAVADGRVAVAFGGDGLVGRVAAVVARDGGLLGVLPGGRGNDFARSVGVPGRPLVACRVLTSGAPYAVDLGEVDGRAFLGIASAGIDGVVQERAARARLPLGRLSYAAAALGAVGSWRPVTFGVVVDGTPYEVTGWSCAGANSSTYGGGMWLAPQASLTDGLLDVVTSGATSRTAFVRAIPRLFRGTHVRLPSVQVRRAAVVELCADPRGRPLTVWADGEPVGSLPCRMTVRRGALRVLLPADTPDGDARRAALPAACVADPGRAGRRGPSAGRAGARRGTGGGMTSPAAPPPVPDHELEPVAADPGALPRPEEEVADAGAPTPEPAAPPTAQLDLSGEPAQGEGASDSY